MARRLYPFALTRERNLVVNIRPKSPRSSQVHTTAEQKLGSKTILHYKAPFDLTPVLVSPAIGFRPDILAELKYENSLW
jgi:hypothetical protein